MRGGPSIMVITSIMPLRQQKLRIGGPAVTAIAGNQFSVVGLLRICHIINNIADCLTLSAPLADMQGHDACGCHRRASFPKKKRTAVRAVLWLS